MKSLFIALLAILAFFACYEWVDRQFKVDNISFNRLPKGHFKTMEDLVSIPLEDPFTYLDRGKQSYVFLSHNKKYVLKLFDARVLTPSIFNFADEKSLERKKQRLFQGYKLAFERDRDITGIIALQLTPVTGTEDRLVTLIDRFGFTHHVNLNEVPFVIQRYAIPTRIVISSLLEKGDLRGAKHHLRQILDMYLTEYTLGLCDRDHNFMYNTGFIDNQPIRLDVGRLYADDLFKNPNVFMHDLNKIAVDRVNEWMLRHYPQYQKEIMADMELKLKNISLSFHQEPQ